MTKNKLLYTTTVAIHFAYTTIILKPVYSGKEVYFDIHQDAALLNRTNYQNSEREFFYIREQHKVSFTARLTSFILQQYKIGFKVELKYIKV